MRRAAAAVGLTLAVFGLSHAALAAKYRRPFSQALGVKYGFDHDGSKTNGSCQSFDCGGTCYDGHKGSDFPLPLGTEVVAAADGTATTVVQGCPDVGSLGSTCGGGFGNYVKLTHDNGQVTYYGHMKDGSITVAQGAAVKCGQKIGLSATSGSSTGPHLHFEPRDGGTTSVDPFAGGCSQTTSLWVQQSGALPGDQCENPCACSAGQTQDQACGKCGVQHRSCNAACQWDGWGACGSEGACAPAATEESACACGGTQARTCQSTCQWGPYDACPTCPEAGAAGGAGTSASGGSSGSGGSQSAAGASVGGQGGSAAAAGNSVGGKPGTAGKSGQAGKAAAGAGTGGRAGATPAGASGRTNVALSADESTEQGGCTCGTPRSSNAAGLLPLAAGAIALMRRRKSPR